MSFIDKLFGDQSKKSLKKFNPLVTDINKKEGELNDKSDTQIAESFLVIRKDLESGKKKINDVVADVFALVREAAKRTLKQRHYDVQMLGGLALYSGAVAEMKTGEGKTLVATLPASLMAATGKGVHIITVNDYLARRDCQWMGQIYDFLGLSVGVIQHEAAFKFSKDKISDDSFNNLVPISRKEAYNCDITYGTNNEYGFDYLRDNMAPSVAHMVQRDLHFCIIDEVDSILIDEARTPLIISAPSEASSDQYKQFARHITQLSEGEDYNVDEKMRAVTLTEEGIKKMEVALGIDNIYTAGGIETVHHIEQALRAKALFKKNKDYVVKDGEVIIVDEFTGRLMHGRRYSEGLHQAIEAKEGANVQQENKTMATITFQNFFRMYERMSGMTGTAVTEAEEFSKIYGSEVISIPTNEPVIRNDMRDRIYKSEKGKFIAVAREIKCLREKGQPVLIGTISIEKNELLGSLLEKEGVPYEVLNAKNHEREANIIENAGKRGAVTLATNMAGRGVDIKLGGSDADEQTQEEIIKLGGLFVLGTERHESRRIDNQLRGRAGRQGDPGASQFYVSLEDDLMRIFGSDRIKSMMERLGMPEDVPIENSLISKSIETAQKKVEGHNFDIRKHLVEYDDVINKHRDVIYKKRRKILFSEKKDEGISEDIFKLIQEEIERVVQFHTSDELPDNWNLDEVYEVLDSMFPSGLQTRMKIDELKQNGPEPHQIRDSIISFLSGLAKKSYDDFSQSIGEPQRIKQIERAVFIRAIDTLWVEHLSLMDYLRQGIGLRGYGQRDPLVEYKKEAFKLFNELLENIRHQVVYTIFKVRVTLTPPEQTQQPLNYVAPQKSSSSNQFLQTNAPQPPTPKQSGQLPVGKEKRAPDGQKIGRNDPCWCGSGKKYKKCHGA